MSALKRLLVAFKGSRPPNLPAMRKSRLADVSDKIKKGIEPSSDDVETLERLGKIDTAYADFDRQRRKKYEYFALCLTVLIFAALSILRVGSTPADLDVRAMKIHLMLTTPQSITLIPGEMGQILPLKEARVTGIESVPPEPRANNGTLEVRALTLLGKSPSTSVSAEDLAARLQEIALPAKSPISIVLGVAYDGDLRGLTLATSAANPIRVVFGEVIPLEGDAQEPGSLPYAIRSVRVAGKHLSLEFVPAKNVRQLTIFRDLRVSGVLFEDEDHSTILGGAAYVRGGVEQSVLLQPSDRLVVGSDEPLLIRELTLSGGELHARISARRASTLLLGEGPPRNLRPTLFQWIRYHWPGELYTTLSALVVAWLAIRKWAESGE